MITINVFNHDGKSTGEATLDIPKEGVSLQALSQALHVYRDRSHQATRKTKRRGEVNRTTKKVYKQKGTGGARHGARSAPIFVGGGVTHGPDGVKRELSLSQALKQKALSLALSRKAAEGKLVGVKSLGTIKKTKEAQSMLSSIAKELKLPKDERFMVVSKESKRELYLAFRNISQVVLLPMKDLNASNVFWGGTLVLEESLLGSKEPKKKVVKATK